MLISKGLSFVPTPKIIKNEINQAAIELGRKLKLKLYFRFNCNSYSKNTKTFTSKSNWVPPLKAMDPDLIECIDNFTDEIEHLEVLKEKPNLSPLESQTLKQIGRYRSIVFKKADKGCATVIMDKHNYLKEGYRQLNNNLYYQKLNAPLFPETSIKITEILNRLQKIGSISEKQLEYLLPPEDPRPRRFYMLPKIHKPRDCWTVPNKMPPGRPIVSDCHSESKRVASFIDRHLKYFAIEHPSYIKNTYDFVDKIKKLTIPDGSILITLDVESMYTNIDHTKGLKAVAEALTFSGPFFDSIMELLELSLKNNDFLFNGEWYLQKTGTSMGRDWAPHYADIYMAKFEKEALLKCPLKPHTYYRYLDDIFMVWPHGEDAFIEFLNILNEHEPPIKFKSTTSKESIDFLDTTIFKNPSNTSELLTKVFFKPTDTHQLLDKTSFHPKHTFKGLLKSQITRFFRICSKQTDFDKAWSVLFKSLCKRNYSKRWLRSVKSSVVRELQISHRRLNSTNPTTSGWGANPCLVSGCKNDEILQPCSNITSTATKITHGIIGKLDCASENVIYVLQCTLCHKQYVGETNSELRVRSNGHRYSINHQLISSSLYMHLQEHVEEYIDLPEPSLVDYILIPIEKVTRTGIYSLDKLNRLKRETFWIDTLETLEPRGINKKRLEDIIIPSVNKNNVVPFVVPFSRTANRASRIINKHYKILQQTIIGTEFFHYKIITAYSKHRNLASTLVSSKM